jgi:hypothetical protein
LLSRITGIQALEVVVELGIRQPDEFGKRRASRRIVAT